jgi:ABC-2 type transport system permease protein
MNGTLLLRTLAAQRLKLAAVVVALAAWGVLMPTIYATFGAELREIFESGIFPQEFTNFGGGDVFSLSGSIALGLAHPIAVALVSVFAVGFSAASVAGERQRGTLEILLARPISRRRIYATLLVATLLFVGIALAAVIVGSYVSSIAWDVAGEIQSVNLALVWLNAWLLYAVFACIGLAASISFDRLSPALGITIAVVLLMYFAEIIGSLWPDARWLQDYSLFHYLTPKRIIESGLDPVHLGLLTLVGALAVVYALVVFPRRDITAPS